MFSALESKNAVKCNFVEEHSLGTGLWLNCVVVIRPMIVESVQVIIQYFLPVLVNLFETCVSQMFYYVFMSCIFDIISCLQLKRPARAIVNFCLLHYFSWLTYFNLA